MIWLRKILNIIGCILIAIAIIFVQIFTLNIFPAPYNHVNIIITAILLWLVFSADLGVLWLVLPVGFLSELLSTMPFGVISFSLFVSLALVGWALFNIFPNRSVYIVVSVAMAAVLIFRGLSLTLAMVFGDLTWAGLWANQEVFVGLGYEVLFTVILVIISQIIIGGLVKRLRPEYINLSLNNGYGKERKHFWNF